MAKYPHTWTGKGLRLVDLLAVTERKQILDFLGSERRFQNQHVRGDASEFLRNAQRMGVLNDYDEIVTRPAPVRTLETMGFSVVTAMDGRREVMGSGQPIPLRGTIPPGSKSVDQIAHDYLVGLQAEGQTPAFPSTITAKKMVFVSPEFGEYLRANNELVKAFEKDGDGDVAFIWPAKNDGDLQRMLQNYHLASYGANDPQGGELAKMVSIKAPKQFAAWSAGMADQWRMMEALREIVLAGAAKMTSGAYADKAAGGELQRGLTAFQQAFQMMAEDAMAGEPRRATAERMMDMGACLTTVGMYLENAPIMEVDVRRLVTDAVDLSATIADDLNALCTKNERDRNRTMNHSIGADAGLG